MSEHPPLQQRKDSKRFGEKDLSSDEIKQQYKPASLKSAKSRIQLIHNEESRKVEDAVTKACAGKPGGGGLTRGETKTVIKELFEDPRAEVRDDGLDTMLASCAADAAPGAGALVAQTEVTAAIKKYRAYLEHQAIVDAVYAKYDADGSGKLERAELETMMRAIAADPDKMREEFGLGQTPFAGVPVHVDGDEMSEAIAAVLLEADADHDGCIQREESVAAIGIWLRFIYKLQRDEWKRSILEKKTKKKKSSSCVLS